MFRWTADLRGDRGAPVAALRAVPVVAEAPHQRLPRLGDPFDTPAGARRLPGEAVSRQRRTHDVESRGGQRFDHLVELDDRPRPAVRDQQRKGVVGGRPLVDEMDVEPVDFGGELVKPVQRGFACAPVVFACPVVGQLAGVTQRDALRPVVDALGLRPSRAAQPVLQVV
jgi:hypothetical protein